MIDIRFGGVASEAINARVEIVDNLHMSPDGKHLLVSGHPG